MNRKFVLIIAIKHRVVFTLLYVLNSVFLITEPLSWITGLLKLQDCSRKQMKKRPYSSRNEITERIMALKLNGGTVMSFSQFKNLKWAHKLNWELTQSDTGRKNEMMKRGRKERGSTQKVSLWIMNAAFISSSLPRIFLSHHPSSPALPRSTPANLSHIKERRGCGDAGLTQTRHAARHVTGSKTMTALTITYRPVWFTYVFLPLCLLEMRLQFPPVQIVAKSLSIMSRTRADPTHWVRAERAGRLLITFVNISRVYYEQRTSSLCFGEYQICGFIICSQWCDIKTTGAECEGNKRWTTRACRINSSQIRMCLILWIGVITRQLSSRFFLGLTQSLSTELLET